MATSGSTDFNRTRNEIITRALRLVSAIEAGESPEAEEMTSASEALNAMLHSWQAEGFRLWTMDEGVLHLVKGQTEYSLGPSGDDATTDGDAVKTELASDAASGAGSIEVDSITGISDSDNIGIELDDGTLQWTTVNGAPSGTTVTLSGTLNSAASEDNHVYAYTTKLRRPLRVTNIRRRQEDDTDVPISMISRQEYFALPNKTNEGKPTQCYYDPQLTNGTLHVWLAPDSVQDRLIFTCVLPIEDFDSASDNPDFPQEWINCLTFNLALDLAIEYAVSDRIFARIAARAGEEKAKMNMWDQEPEPLYFSPDREGWE